MRRFGWTIITLALLGGAVFLIGWLPLRLEPGSYAVLVTKTGGVDARVVAPGGFRWSAAALLPTNVRLVKLSPRASERSLEVSGELPSAAAYSAFMAGQPDFTYAFSARIIAAPDPSDLPALYERWGVADDESLSAWLESEIELAASDLRAALRSVMDGSGDIDEASLALAVSAGHPSLDVRGVRIVSSRTPDPRLYEEARRLYSSYMDRFRASVEPVLVAASSRAAEDQVRIDVLQRYGELLERYPSLVDYLAIEAGIPPRPVVGK
ncbi:MAG: hypothetical protein CVV47_04935 [Spirochaetae bacterium HGW-Spirochaetae-3]|jgi:hypothetical protein|nr:MAG: hypothetical protein CVV47_04935 [Spirochaetae bacterium HGW-Spirochaetae-3]